MSKIVNTSGKRKRAIARATIKEGKGIVKINNINLEVYSPKLARMKIKEPLILSGSLAHSVDISVNVNGGGVISGADAVRLAIARGLVEYSGKADLRETFLEYDRTLIVADVRYKETCKPNISRARARRQKSYR